MRPRSTNHPFQPKPPITKVSVPSLCRESIARSSLKSIQPFLWYRLIECFLSVKLFLSTRRFFLLLLILLLLILIHFRPSWACANPGDKYSIWTYVCLSHKSLISSWISIKFASAILLCMLYLWNNFQPKAST